MLATDARVEMASSSLSSFDGTLEAGEVGPFPP
jgi:hypothetical protein